MPLFSKFRRKQAGIADCSNIPQYAKDFLSCLLEREGQLSPAELDLAMDIQYNPDTGCCDFGYNVGCSRKYIVFSLLPKI